MILRHIHLSNITNYTHASKLQQKLVSAFLAHKANRSIGPPPKPTIITAEFHPVYTCGRREVGHLAQEQIDFLRSPIADLGQAEFHEALRGGQTTFHGRGQLVAYPILDLKRHGLTARCYVNLLESSVIETCAHYGVKTQRTENPGVWTDEMHKICALGVHLRRNVSSHGVGLNLSTDTRWFDRIVACGLGGKRTTSLELQGVRDVTVRQVGRVFVEHMKELLDGLTSIEEIGENDLD